MSVNQYAFCPVLTHITILLKINWLVIFVFYVPLKIRNKTQQIVTKLRVLNT